MGNHAFDMANTVALVTGANRGLGAAFVQALEAAGAKRIYAASRDPDKVATGNRIVPLRLDVTKAEQVADAGLKCADVTLLINNAGVAYGPPRWTLQASAPPGRNGKRT